MKVGNLVGGLEVVDVKRVNKLNLIQFLKEVDNYLQQGYKLDVNSARQVGLVLQVDTYKTEAACSPKVGSTGVKVEAKANEEVKADVATHNVVQETTNAEPTAVEPTPVKKPTTTRSKKTTQ